VDGSARGGTPCETFTLGIGRTAPKNCFQGRRKLRAERCFVLLRIAYASMGRAHEGVVFSEVTSAAGLAEE